MPLDDITDDSVSFPDGVRLALRRAGSAGDRRPFLLVHGLASNSRIWDGVTVRLAAAGREVVAIDLRGHGRSDDSETGHSTEGAASDLAFVCQALGFTGERAPVVAGQSWGGNVVLALAASHGGVAATACLDGGWIALGDSFQDFEACWRRLAPPAFDGMRYAAVRQWILDAHPDWPREGVEGALSNLVELPDGGVRNRLAREHHKEILRSLWAGDPRELYPLVKVPVLLMPAGSRSRQDKSSAVDEALAALPHAEVSWYDHADHDIHAQHPQRVTDDLLALDERASAA